MKVNIISQNTKPDFTISEKGDHVFFMANYSGALNIDIQSEDVKVYIFGAYVGTNSEIFTINTIQKHSIGKNISDLLIKGVFYDESKFIYEGLIKIEPGAQQSNAYQKNQNLILSDGVFVDSRPFLEIAANDVRCTHGSTTGRLNKEDMLYVQTRGINKTNAEKLIVLGYISEVFLKMEEIGVPEDDTRKAQKTIHDIIEKHYHESKQD